MKMALMDKLDFVCLCGIWGDKTEVLGLFLQMSSF